MVTVTVQASEEEAVAWHWPAAPFIFQSAATLTVLRQAAPPTRLLLDSTS